MNRGGALAAGLLVAGLLAGCAQIPSTSPVVAGAANNPDPREGIFQFIPYGPRDGAKPAELVRGFIGAAAGFSDDHRVARTFLADSRKLTWKPDATVQVFGDYADLSVRSAVAAGGRTAEVTVRGPATLRLDGDGRYSPSKPGARVAAKYTLTKDPDGQWRISELDNGILIAQADFDAIFRAFPVYFPDPSGSYLIPDVHWFAGTRDLSGSPEIPTALVRELLQGPPSWLQGAVTTGAPAGTAMALGAVVVDDEVADVDLTGSALDADTDQRRMLAGQLQATLGQLRPIASVRITVRQAEYDTSGPARPAGADNRTSWLRMDPSVGDQALVVDAKDRLAWLTGRSTLPVLGVDGLQVAGVNHPALSADHLTFAVLDAARGRLLMQVQGADRASVVTRGADLSPPSFDPGGWVWTGPADNRGFVYAGHTGASTVRVQARWLDGSELVGLRISRDGARALVSVRSRGRGHVFMAGVLREADGRPTTLTQPIGLIPDLTDVADAAWVDEDQVAVLGRRAGGEQQVWLAQIGGPVVGRGRVPASAQTVTAGDGESSLSVGTPSGTYSYLRGWQKASSDRYPAYPG